MKPDILLIEDDEIMRVTVSDYLGKKGWPVSIASDGFEGSELVKKKDFDIVICDMRLPKKNGLELLKEIKEYSPDSEVIMITAYGKIEDAVEAMRLGACDYITKPFSLDELVMRIERVMEHHKLKMGYHLLQESVKERYSLQNLIGKSKKMQGIFNIIERVSKIDSNIIIFGESGTGKGTVAKVIHQISNRASKPFVKVSCAALTETLLESELFGHEKGAFTGAIRKRYGRFELANGGTIFLDEVGDIPLSIQVKLLRVIQEHEFERVGGEETIKVDVRLISATKKDLEKAVEDGNFREDLYYRLKVIPIYLPTLRERKEDIPLLVADFTKRVNEKLGKDVQMSPDAMKYILDYDFPGNIRELENIIERAVAFTQGKEIRPRDIMATIIESSQIMKEEEIVPLKDMLNRAERAHLIKVLERTDWNKVEAAKLLGISRKNLWEKLKFYKLTN